ATQRRLLTLVGAGPVLVTTLQKDSGISRAVVAGLLRRGLLEPVVERTMRKPAEQALAGMLGPVAPFELTPLQATAFAEVMNWVDRRQHRTLVLHGVTGSGKTEIYLQAVSRTLEQGRTALVLLPEIALTPRALELFRARFGQRVAILHSALSFGERNDEWWRIRKGQASVVIGTRSAVFAPLENLGLIVVDEEHDTSYKQEETPMYNGRDTAIFRGHLDGAAVVLSSATPALETYFQAVEKKKFEYVSLPERVQNRPLPTVHIIDMREEFNKFGKAAVISEFLRDQIAVRLQRRQQVIVLLNRRGYYAFLLCRSCGLTVHCHQCSITLTYHRGLNRLVCHYCGYQRSVPAQCENCRGEYIYYLGEGTEKIEEILGKLFPNAKLARLDRDTTRRKGSFEKILGKFAAGQIDLLVGTQMLAKGHDYPNVTLVGVLSADLGLRMPDFRAAERTFQLLTQVAGRAGRGELPGDVVIQTYYPNHYSLRYACVHDYPEFYAHEIEFRRNFFYPPFSSLANLVVQHTDPARARKLALQVGRSLTAGRDRLGTPAALRVIGPARAAIEKIKGRHRYQIIVKSSDRALLHSFLQEALQQLDHSQFPHRHLRVDIDPVTLL
ncbi:MAG: replication restart helicase PriA, partial [Acidobacteriota bacterium]